MAEAPSYEQHVAGFRWRIPDCYNIAAACCDDWAARDADRTALLRYESGRPLASTTYGDLRRMSVALAHVLRDRGVGRGDRVAILLPQSVETVVAHLAAYRLGAIAVPLAILFGPDALRHRLTASGASVVIAGAVGMKALDEIRADLPTPPAILCTDGAAPGADSLPLALEGAASADLPIADTAPDDPALMIFTSGTTGQPKGALHGHRVLPGHLPGIHFTHWPMPSPDDRFWTPSDWAWAGGLLNCLLPALALGVPVVFGPFRKFDPGEACALMAEAGVRNAFLPPTALRMMRGITPPRRSDLSLRTVGAAGEALGRDVFSWAIEGLGVPVNEFYGQTECNYVLGSSAALAVARAGTIGKAIPGHAVAVVGADGRPVAAGEPGEIAVRQGDPAMFLGYWNDEAATAAKFVGDWMLTGDRATADADGYVRFVGRADDLITSAGYRIGPTEVEDCIAAHPAVALVAVVGKPDALRTEIVKAYVTLKPGVSASPQLAEEIQAYVRTRLSAAEYPREVAFVDTIPLTTSGKVIRRHFRALAADEAAARDGLAPAD